MRDGRPRPVALEMPLDVMALETEVVLPSRNRRWPSRRPTRNSSRKRRDCWPRRSNRCCLSAEARLARPKRCSLLAKCSRRRWSAIPAAKASSATGIISPNRLLAGHDLWRDADVVLAVGTRLNQPQARWGIDADLKLIRIDIDPTEITRILRPALGIVADARRRLLR